MQLGDRSQHDVRARRQLGTARHAARHADRPSTGRARHPQVGGGVADHRDTPDRDARPVRDRGRVAGIGLRRDRRRRRTRTCSTSRGDAEPASVASVGRRSSVVATAIRRPASGASPNRPRGRPAARAAATGSGSNHASARIRRAALHARAPAPEHGTRRSRGSRPSSRSRVAHRAGSGRRPGRTRSSAKTSPATGRRVAISSRVPSSRAQPDHIASNEMSVPSLSKTTTSIPSRIGWSAVDRRSGDSRPRASRRARSLRPRRAQLGAPGLRRAGGRASPPAGTRS